MVYLAPSILSANFANLAAEIKKVEGADYLHLDIMDGRFVPNITFGPGLIRDIRPHSNLIFDTHLMIVEPEKYISQFAEAGSEIITVHLEAVTHLDRVVQLIKDCGCQAGVALNPATPLAELEYILPELDQVLIMSVNPGFGGQKLLPYTLQKVRDLKKMIENKDLNVKIQIDGGVNLENIQEVAKAGVDIIIAGSAIFASQSPAETIKQMRSLLQLDD